MSEPGGEIRKKKPVTSKPSVKAKNFVAYCERYYFLNNAGFPTPEQAALALGYSVAEINTFLQNKHILRMLQRRGLPYQTAGMTQDGSITPTQTAAALVVMNFADERPIDVKLDSIGVQSTQYYSWLNDPNYRNFVNRLADQNLGNVRPEAIANFVSLVRQGDFKTLQYYFEVTGEFTQPQVGNLQVVIQRIIEAVQRHVKDPEILAKISQEVLGAAPTVANGVQVNVIEDSGRSNALVNTQTQS